MDGFHHTVPKTDCWFFVIINFSALFFNLSTIFVFCLNSIASNQIQKVLDLKKLHC